MKKTLKTLTILILLIAIASVCFATSDDTPVVTATEDGTTESEDVSNEDINSLLGTVPQYEEKIGDIYGTTTEGITPYSVIYGNVYIAGDDLDLEAAAIFGNLFILGDDIKITAEQISGSVFVLGKNVEINSIVGTSVYALGNKITANIQTYNLYAIAENITVEEKSLVLLDSRLLGKTITFNGTSSDGNLYTSCEKLFVGDSASIAGNIEYTGEISVPGTIDESKLIQIETVKLDTEEIEEAGNNVKKFILSMSIVTSVLVLVLIGCIMAKKSDLKTDIKENVFKDIGLGLLLVILIPIACVILMITIFGIGAAFLFLALYCIILVLFSIPTACIEISKLIMENRNITTVKVIILAIVLRVCVILLEYIPAVGGIVSLVLSLYGFGFILRKLFERKKVVVENKQEEIVSTNENNSYNTIEETNSEVVEENSVNNDVPTEVTEVVEDTTNSVEEETSNNEPIVTTDDVNPISSNDETNNNEPIVSDDNNNNNEDNE